MGVQAVEPPRPISRRPWHLAFFAFLSSHIVFTLLIDAQAALLPWAPRVYHALYPRVARQLLMWYLEVSYDPLMGSFTSASAQWTWFRSMVVAELVFQLPVFVMACHALWFDRLTTRMRTLLVIYGAHAATTLIPVMSHLAVDPSIPDWTRRAMLLGCYVPYLAFPVAIVLYFGFLGTPEVSAREKVKAQ